jgi:hypothetical protein
MKKKSAADKSFAALVFHKVANGCTIVRETRYRLPTFRYFSV